MKNYEKNPQKPDGAIWGFDGEYRFLSNFYHAPVMVTGIKYLNTEAAFQAGKSLNMEERELFSEMSPAHAKRMGRKIKLRADWHIAKIEVMELCLRTKFMTHKNLAEQLKATGNAELVEFNTWGDSIWGVTQEKGGTNLLGKLLMIIRNDLKKG